MRDSQNSMRNRQSTKCYIRHAGQKQTMLHAPSNHPRKLNTGSDTENYVKGQLTFSRTYSDMLIHLNQGVELKGSSLLAEREAALTLGVLMEGKLHFALDDKEYEFSVQKKGQPLFFIINTTQRTHWRKYFEPGNQVKKALICLPNQWFRKLTLNSSDIDNIAQSVSRRHKFSIAAKASSALITAAHTLFDTASISRSELEREAIALNFLSTSMTDLKHLNPELKLKTSAKNQSKKMHDYIEMFLVSGEPPQTPNLEAIAKHVGVSVSTAQRIFKADFKQSIIDYVRSRRLENAQIALLNGLSIGEVAYSAGYKHSNNFSIAYKKHFGVSPGTIKYSND